ncbi:MAG: hypothetical protein ACOCRX_06300 [Candidatus Woesearchaeota archaeon]
MESDEMVLLVKTKDQEGNIGKGLFSFQEGQENEVQQKVAEYYAERMIEIIEAELFYKREINMNEK